MILPFVFSLYITLASLLVARYHINEISVYRFAGEKVYPLFYLSVPLLYLWFNS